MNIKITRNIASCFFSVMFLAFVPAQILAKEIKTLYIEDAVTLALAYSPIVELSELQRVVEKFSLKLAYNKFMPQYSLVAASSIQEKGDYNFLINPSITWKSKFGLDAAAVLDINGLDDSKASFTFDLPLLRGSGSIAKIPLDNAIDQEEINRLNYRDSIASVINKVQAQYFKVLSLQKQQDIIKISVARSQDTLKEYELKVAAGDMPKANIAQQQAQITSDNLKLETNEFQLKEAYRSLMLLLGLSPKTEYKIDSAFDPKEEVIPSLDNSINRAKQFNYKYRQMVISMHVLERNLRQAKDDSRVKLDLSAVVTSDGESSATISASVPINDETLDYDVVAAQTAYDQGEIKLQQAEYDLVAETTNLITDLRTKLKQIELAKLNVSYAKKNYDNTRASNLYGKSSAYEVVSQMQKYMQSEIDLISFKIDFYTTFAELNKFLGLTLDKWQVKLVM